MVDVLKSVLLFKNVYSGFNSERASEGKFWLSASGLAENGVASRINLIPFTLDNGLGMAENSGEGSASWALNIHKEGVGGLNQTLQLVYLFLVGVLGVQ